MQMNQREKNLEALDRRYPGMKELIEKRKKELLKKEQLKIEEEISLEERTILKVSKDGRQLYLSGRRNAIGPARNQIGLLGQIEDTAPIFMIGLGNPYYLEELTKIPHKKLMILLYEPSFTIFYEILKYIDIDQLFQNHIIALCVEGINADHYDKLMIQMLNGERIALMKTIILPNYEIICPEKVRDFIKTLEKLSSNYQININTGIKFSEVKADNFFHNVKYVPKNYQACQLTSVLPLDVPAIVVSAGPSLNKNVQDLKEAKNHAFIIAVDTAIKPLLNAGVIPDMFAIIDGMKPLNLIEREECKEIPLISTIDAAKAVLDFHTGKKFFYNENQSYVNHLFEMNHKEFKGMILGGSVATLAFSLVCYVGFHTVILVGQDLAYTGNRTHADGTFAEHMEKIDTSRYMMVSGNCEEKVPTDTVMNDYRIWFEDFIEFWRQDTELCVINATEGGARIDGTEVMTLKEAIEKKCTKTVDISSCINRLEPVFSKDEQKKITQFFQDTPRQIHQIVIQAQEGQKLYKKLKKQCESKNMVQEVYLKILKQIKRVTKKIEKNPNYQMISDTMKVANTIITTSQYMEYDSFEEEGKEIARKGIQYMELVEQCANLFEKLALETVAKVTD